MVWIGAAAVFLMTFGFRWLTLTEFTNDHFDPIAIAQQLRLGGLPVRDFADEGLLFTYLSSAVAWAVLKAPFLAEAAVVSLGFAIAAALSFVVATRVSGSVMAASFAVLAQVALYPRSYSYPKVLVQSVAVAVALWALERLTTRRLAALAATTALGYYFRHDHGVYLGIASVVLLCAAQWQTGLRTVTWTVARYAALVCAFVLPHLVYIQWAAGIPTYLAISRGYVTGEAAEGVYRPPLPSLDPQAGLWIRRAAPEVSIRWVPGLDAASRTRLEGRYRLEPAGPAEGTTQRYRILDISETNQRAIRADSQVEDTHGFDRLSQDGHARGLNVGPGWRLTHNSMAVLYWFYWLHPFAALAILYARRHLVSTRVTSIVTMLAALAIVTNATFLRSPLDVRLPDVGVPHSIMGAWLIATLWRWQSTAPARALRRSLVVVAAAKVLIAIGVLSHMGQLVQTAGIADGADGIVRRWNEITSQLRNNDPRLAPSNPAQALLPFFAYLRACTRPDERILHMWFSPEVYILADRGYGGEYRKYFAPFHSARWEQARTIARLKQQHVPFILVPKERRELLETTYADLWEYIRSRYVPMAEIPAGDPGGTEILREQSWTSTRAYGATGWPCLR